MKKIILILIAGACLQAIFTPDEPEPENKTAILDPSREPIGYCYQRGTYIYKDEGLVKNTEGDWVLEKDIVLPEEPKPVQIPEKGFDMPNF